MKSEMYRLTVLFATFVIAYTLRFVYQLGLGNKLYVRIVPNMVTRWYLVNAMPLIWDITSILSILILHKMSFSEENSSRVPKAGHYSTSGGLPNIEETSSLDTSFVSEHPHLNSGTVDQVTCESPLARS